MIELVSKERVWQMHFIFTGKGPAFFFFLECQSSGCSNNQEHVKGDSVGLRGFQKNQSAHTTSVAHG